LILSTLIVDHIIEEETNNRKEIQMPVGNQNNRKSTADYMFLLNIRDNS